MIISGPKNFNELPAATAVEVLYPRLTESFSAANFQLLAAKRIIVGDKQFVR